MVLLILLVTTTWSVVTAYAQDHPVTVPTVTSGPNVTRSRQNAGLASLQRSLRRDDVEQAAVLIDELLLMGTDPVILFHQIRAAVTPRGLGMLPGAMTDLWSQDLDHRKRELLLLMAVETADEASADSLMRTLGSAADLSVSLLSTIGANARTSGNISAAVWAYTKLAALGGSAMHSVAVPLAECLVEQERTEEAVALLDSFLDASRAPQSSRDKAKLLRARLIYQYEGNSFEALALVTSVRGRRERIEAELLATLIHFLETGSDSLARQLERLARARPDVMEANDAFDLARLSSLLPVEDDAREAVLSALRLDFRQQWEAAASAYSRAWPLTRPPLASYLEMREARCLECVNEFEQALTVWDRIVAREEGNVLALLGKGDCLTSMGLPDSARSTYLAILRRYPESPHAARARSRLLD